MTSQATSTRLNQRRVARSRSVVARRASQSRATRQTTMPSDPENQDPEPSPSSATPTRQSTKSPRARATSSPHPRTASAIRE